ncbi:MAG: hypothetical protein E7Z83_08585 [Methanobrevibacter sp.]|nr:pseudomurein-binding repeat-containing protein [Methanobrevibacter sp.]MBE6490897.1 hypothetical protein [Methanobrevibacter sp.]
MNKQLLLTAFLALIVVFSVSAVCASEVSVTDSYATSLVDDTSDVSVPLEKTADSSEISVSSDSNVDNDSSKVSLSSEEVLGSENSNTLSTVTYSNDDGENGVTSLSVSSDDVYGDSGNVSSTVDIADTIKSSDISKYYKGSTKYTATFTDEQGNVLANTNVKIVLNGVTKTVKTNANGVASLAVDLKPGTYKVVATNPVTGYQKTNTFKVLTTIKASDVTKVYTDAKKFTATFLKSNGKALANKNVKFKINGKTYTVKTNSNGVASLSMTNLKKGTYKMISYNTDGLTKTNTVKVVSSTTSKLTASAYNFLKSTSTKKIKVNLLNGLGYAPGSGKIIKFTVNGKTYTSKTNSNGNAYLTLPNLANGVYTVKYKFDGNAFYKASSTSSKVTILPSKTPTFTVKSGTTFGNGAGNSFKVALTSGSVPLASKTVTLTLDGNTYTKTTDSNGVVSLPISLAVGKYTITYNYKGDSFLNAKTASSTITVKERAPTTITWSKGTFEAGSQTFRVLLKDSDGNGMGGETVKLTVNGKTYSVTTFTNGCASFDLNLPAGNYTATFNYEATGDNDNAPSSYSKSISIIPSENNLAGYGYWLFGGDMKSVDLSSLASKGTTELFLNYFAVEKWGKSSVESWIASANKYGMRVHIWMQTFYDGGWINPVKNGSPNTAYFNQVINEAKEYASLKGVAGIHFDYMRYPGTAYKTTGGTAAISQFAKLASQALHALDPHLIVSCAVMPETTSNAYYYGQDMAAISSYMDVVVPMIYKGNYGKSTSWITTTTKWFVDNSKGAVIWSGVQSYKSDDDVTKLSTTDLTKDAQAGVNGKATGVMIFRWGITNFVDFNSLTGKVTPTAPSSPSTDSSSTSSSTVTLANILTAADTLKSTISSTGAVPSKVTVGGVSYTTPQFLYMMAQAVVNLNDGKTSAVSVLSASAPANSAGDSEGQLSLEDYVDVATRLANYISTHKQAPNYASSTLGNIKYENLVDAFSRIVAYYKNHSQLPKYVTISEIKKSSSSTTTPTTDTSTATSKTISIKNVLTGATNLKTYYANNGKLPATVTAGGITFTLPEFLYVMSQAIYQIGNSNTKDITYISGVSAPESPYGDTISSEQLTKDNYITVANNVAKFISTNKLAPNYASSDVGKIIYSELVDSFSRVLAYYNTNNELPNYVVVTYGSSSSSSSLTATGTGLNEANKVSDLTAYLKSSTNCQVGNSAIKSVVNSITSGLTSDYDKAVAIYNYVRDKVSYSFYYNTKYGAAGTLSAKTGNCVDQAHLLVAMARTAGLAARYVHGTCYFTLSGSTYGHVWTQILVDGKWYVADATSERNSFGKVVNWNTNSFSLNGIYSGISF